MPIYSADIQATVSRVRFPASQECICSWNETGPCAIDLRFIYEDDAPSCWLPYVRVDPWRSASAHDEHTTIAVDVVDASRPLIGLDVRGDLLERVYVATRPPILPVADIRVLPTATKILDVPAKSQFIGAERGWCNPTCVAMLMAYWAKRENQHAWDVDLATVAHAMFDHAYEGTGNWTFGTAFASRFGLRAMVAYFTDVAHLAAGIGAGIPVAVSLSWEEGELPGAPLPRSDGHLVVVRGFSLPDLVHINDPAHPKLTVSYPARQFAALWQRAGGVGYIIAPTDHEDHMMQLIGCYGR